MNLLLVTLVIMGLVLNVRAASVSASASITGTVSVSSSGSVSGSLTGSGSSSESLTPSSFASVSSSLSVSASTAASSSRSGSGSISASLARNVNAGCQCDPLFDTCCFANCSSQHAGDSCGTALLGAGDCYIGRQCTTTLKCLDHFKTPGTACTPSGLTKPQGVCATNGVCFNPLNPQVNPIKVGLALKKQIVGKKAKKLPKNKPFLLKKKKSNNGRRTRRNRTGRR